MPGTEGMTLQHHQQILEYGTAPSHGVNSVNDDIDMPIHQQHQHNRGEYVHPMQQSYERSGPRQVEQELDVDMETTLFWTSYISTDGVDIPFVWQPLPHDVASTAHLNYFRE